MKLSEEYLTKCRNVCMKYGLDVPPKVVLELLDHIDALESERPKLVKRGADLMYENIQLSSDEIVKLWEVEQ